MSLLIESRYFLTSRAITLTSLSSNTSKSRCQFPPVWSLTSILCGPDKIAVTASAPHITNPKNT